MMNNFLQSWLNTNWKTRLISIMILVISIIMSFIMFVFLIYLQTELINTNFRFFRDFSSLVAYDFIDLMQNVQRHDLKDFAERIYLATSNLDYLQLFDS